MVSAKVRVFRHLPPELGEREQEHTFAVPQALHVAHEAEDGVTHVSEQVLVLGGLPW